MEEKPEPALLEAILDAPDDDTAYLVYGDWLETQGYPRGKLVAIHAALARTTDVARREELHHDAAAVLAKHPELSPPEVSVPLASCAIDWHLGFWRGIRDRCPGDLPPGRVETLLGSRSADFVRHLDFSFCFSDASRDDAFFRAVATKHRSLETLKVRVRKEVDTQWSRSDVRLAALHGCDRLRELSVDFEEQRAGGSYELGRGTLWPSLERLSLHGPGIDDEEAAVIAKQPRLQHLSCPTNDLTAKGVDAIATLPLRSLEIVGSSGREGGYLAPGSLTPLAGHRSIEKVRVASLCPAGARALASLEHLVDLCIFNDDFASNLDPDSIECLAPLADRLRSLRLHDWRAVTDDTCDLLATFAHLETLSLWDTAVTAAGLRKLGPLQKLEHLVLFQSCRLSDEDVRFLSGFRRLQALDLAGQGVAITDACIDDIASMTELRLLNVADTAISARGVTTLADRMPWLVAIGTHSAQRAGLSRPRLRDRWEVAATGEMLGKAALDLRFVRDR